MGMRYGKGEEKENGSQAAQACQLDLDAYSERFYELADDKGVYGAIFSTGISGICRFFAGKRGKD
jgi:hypothetical protein